MESDPAVIVFVDEPAQGDGPVHAGSTPAGRYARLVYRGLGLAANQRLLNGITEGDAFAARYEAYLTDPKLEPRKK